jgi:Gpi18-like mannosyltransferase
MLFNKFKKSLILSLITIVVSLLFWFLFYFNIPGKIGYSNVTLETIFANYDGPNYMVISKCGYDKNCIGPNFSLPQSLEYYPAHLPGYPLLINFFNNFTTGPKAMLFVTLLGSIFLTIIAFELFKTFMTEKKAFWLTIVLMFFPARLFILRQIGAPETWFMATTLASIYFFRNKKILLSAVFAALAQVFKSPGILLFIAYGIVAISELVKNKNFGQVLKKYLPYILVPLTVLGIFIFYYFQTGDFMAYFHSGDNFHLNPLPYLVFISTNNPWVNTIWLEDIIYIFLLSIFGVYKLIKKYKFDIITVYSLVFLVATLLVAHRDISRYIAPIYPLMLLAFKKPLTSKPFRIIFFILLPAIILYAINFIVGNVAPIASWAPYL